MFLQIISLYKLFKHQPRPKEAYVAAWDLRRLYTYAYRRQNDAEKREQVPRDRVGV